MSPDTVRSLLSGDNRNLSAVLLRALLSIAEPLYAVAAATRNWLFDQGLLQIHQCEVPVVSVGNLTTGGTGKTPIVALVTAELQRMGLSPGILSRGYKALSERENDEKRVLDLLCQDVPHILEANRVAGVQRLVREHSVASVVLDDAFQHRRVHRDVDIVVIDALNPWGYGRLLPRGLLREPIAGLRRAHVVLLTRCDALSATSIAELVQQVRVFTKVPVLQTRFDVQGLRSASGAVVELSAIPFEAGQIAAFCGIGNPEGFRKTLQTCAGSEVPLTVFPDHHHYSQAELSGLQTANRPDIWLTTLKDLVKVQHLDPGRKQIYAVEIGLEFLDDPQPLRDLLQQAVNHRHHRA